MYLSLPDPPDYGPPRWISWGKEVVRYIKSIVPYSGAGVSVVDLPGYNGKRFDAVGSGLSSSGSSPQRRPFQLIATTDGEAINPQPRLRITTSTLANDLPDGFSGGDDPPYLLTPTSGANDVWGMITYDVVAGVATVTSRSLNQGAMGSMPNEVHGTGTVEGKFYVLLGSYTFESDIFTSVANYRYGPIDINICRDWFSDDGSYSATASGS